jgi:hypothetical protein
MADPVSPSQQPPLRRFCLHGEMTVSNATFQRRTDISRASGMVHEKRFFYRDRVRRGCSRSHYVTEHNQKTQLAGKMFFKTATHGQDSQ